jgi:hypothetical protein
MQALERRINFSLDGQFMIDTPDQFQSSVVVNGGGFLHGPRGEFTTFDFPTQTTRQ